MSNFCMVLDLTGPRSAYFCLQGEFYLSFVKTSAVTSGVRERGMWTRSSSTLNGQLKLCTQGQADVQRARR